MRIPIKALKEFAQKYKLSHIVVFARDEDGKNHHVATYGKTVEECSQAADWGNKIKKALGWPDSLQAQPSRVRKLQQQLAGAEKSKQDGLNMCANKIHNLQEATAVQRLALEMMARDLRGACIEGLRCDKICTKFNPAKNDCTPAIVDYYTVKATDIKI